LQKLASVDSRRATVERIRPVSSNHRPYSSRCARWTVDRLLRLMAPYGEESKIGGVTDTGTAAVPGQEPGHRQHLPPLDGLLCDDDLDSY
jgi:hypothetical protein